MTKKAPKKAQPDVPVYLFTGFLDSGKTRFMQETLEDKRFNEGERTLILLCEDGEMQFDPTSFADEGRATIYRVENESDMKPELLQKLQNEQFPERVFVEYNGMWMIDRLYESLPPQWVVCQEFTFADANDFMSYNANMRALVFDKLKSCQLAVFNRFDKNVDIMDFHSIVRAINRGCDIAYEAEDGSVRYDDIEDPLPFDIEAPVVEIANRDYALWYRDMSEDVDKYDGKTVRFTARAAVSAKLPKGCFIVGRDVMTCCAEDISFAALIVKAGAYPLPKDGDWVELEAKIKAEEHPNYDRKGPVLTAVKITPAAAPEDEVATYN